MEYTKPQIAEYGDLTELTAGTLNCGFEDGANKNFAHHTSPCPE